MRSWLGRVLGIGRRDEEERLKREDLEEERRWRAEEAREERKIRKKRAELLLRPEEEGQRLKESR